jgi:hypothetical protein
MEVQDIHSTKTSVTSGGRVSEWIGKMKSAASMFGVSVVTETIGEEDIL